MTPKVETLDGAKADTLFWYKNFYAVTASLPPKTWLTSLGTGSGAASQPPARRDAGRGQRRGPDSERRRGRHEPGDSRRDHASHEPGADPWTMWTWPLFSSRRSAQTDAVSFQMTVHLKPEAAAVAAGRCERKPQWHKVLKSLRLPKS